jgi:hypothetical protein
MLSRIFTGDRIMTGKEPRKTPRPSTVLAVAALVATAYVVTRRDQDSAVTVPPNAVGWHGAMEVYRTLAQWAGRRAMLAELHYWEAVN